MSTLNVVFSGNVQGVGFRYAAKKLAVQYRVAGWIRNESDGSVMMSATASADLLNQFLSELVSQYENQISHTAMDWDIQDLHASEFQIQK